MIDPDVAQAHWFVALLGEHVRDMEAAMRSRNREYLPSSSGFP